MTKITTNAISPAQDSNSVVVFGGTYQTSCGLQFGDYDASTGAERANVLSLLRELNRTETNALGKRRVWYVKRQ